MHKTQSELADPTFTIFQNIFVVVHRNKILTKALSMSKCGSFALNGVCDDTGANVSQHSYAIGDIS